MGNSVDLKVTVCIKHKVIYAFKNLAKGKEDKVTNGKLTKEEKTAGKKEDKKDEEMEDEHGEKDEEDEEGSNIFQRQVSDYVHWQVAGMVMPSSRRMRLCRFIACFTWWITHVSPGVGMIVFPVVVCSWFC